jgi:hypothetical protein
MECLPSKYQSQMNYHNKNKTDPLYQEKLRQYRKTAYNNRKIKQSQQNPN